MIRIMKIELSRTPKGLTLDQISRYFSTDDEARKYFECIRWKNGMFCPRPDCGNADEARIYRIKPNRQKKVREGLFQCAECRRQFTVTVGTIFEDSHIPLRKWLIAWYMLCSSKKGVSALQMQRMLGLGSYRSAWYMMQRIRFALASVKKSGKLGGIVEADETYIGGYAKGVGSGNYRKKKTAIVTVVERGGRLRSEVTRRVTAGNLEEILNRNVDHSSTLMTDSSLNYDRPGKAFEAHHMVNHLAGEYLRQENGLKIHTNTVEGFFGNLKRGLNGVYHHVSEKYLPLYLAEFDHRYCERKQADGEITESAVSKADGKRLTLSGLTNGGI